MRDGSDRQLLPAIGTNAGRTGQTKTRTKSETKQTNKKRKNTICVVWMWILFVLFFSQVYFCCFLLRAWDLHARARTRHLCSRPFIASPPSNLLLPLYTFHSHCLFMSFCLCCLHSANCAIFKRRVLVFFTEFWTKPMCVCVWVVVNGCELCRRRLHPQ